jgi:hypothetical protein
LLDFMRDEVAAANGGEKRPFEPAAMISWRDSSARCAGFEVP